MAISKLSALYITGSGEIIDSVFPRGHISKRYFSSKVIDIIRFFLAVFRLFRVLMLFAIPNLIKFPNLLPKSRLNYIALCAFQIQSQSCICRHLLVLVHIITCLFAAILYRFKNIHAITVTIFSILCRHRL